MEVVQAIVLKVFNFSDNQKIVHAFSKERGYISLISPSSFSEKEIAQSTLCKLWKQRFFTQKNRVCIN